jgi:hypothetical protein
VRVGIKAAAYRKNSGQMRQHNFDLRIRWDRAELSRFVQSPRPVFTDQPALCLNPMMDSFLRLLMVNPSGDRRHWNH